jgi:hypothetical protein
MDGVKFENYLQVFEELGGDHNCVMALILTKIYQSIRHNMSLSFPTWLLD